MTNQFVIDNNFDKNITTSYFLSIQLALDGFSFCVLDPISNEYILFYHKNISINESLFGVTDSEIANNEYLQLPYQKTFVLFQTKHNTLIPSSLFDEKQKEDYLNFCFNPNKYEEEITFSHKIKMADSYCIFSIPEKFSDLLSSKFSNVFYFNQTIPFIESALLNTTFNTDQHLVYINVQNSCFDIIIIAGNNLKLHNTFNFHNKKEFLYYTLLVFEQLKLNTHTSHIYLSGRVSKTDDIYSMLKKYIKHVEIANESKHFKFAAVFKQVSLVNHINLINIPLCV